MQKLKILSLIKYAIVLCVSALICCYIFKEVKTIRKNTERLKAEKEAQKKIEEIERLLGKGQEAVDEFDLWTQYTITLTPTSQQVLNEMLDSLLIMIHSDFDTRLNALEKAVALAPTIIFNYDNPDIDSLLLAQMGDKLNRINYEWCMEILEDGNYLLSKEILKNDDYITLSVILDKKTKKCNKMIVGFPENANKPFHFYFLKGDILDSLDESTLVSIDSIIRIPDTQFIVGLPEAKTFENFLTNKTLLIGYFMEGEFESALLRLDYLQKKYDELLQKK